MASDKATIDHKVDRPGSLYGMTRSVCPDCLRMIDAEHITRDGAIIMRKWCPDHGWFESLIARNAERHLAQRRFNKPGTMPLYFEREFKGCPDSCGLCPEHQQHTCLGILEITQDCNLSCPVCFADASHAQSHLSMAQIGDMLDRLKKCEGNPEVIQLSGGEPTRHPHLIDVIQMAYDKGYEKVLVNTNGVRIVEDPAFLDELARVDPTVYLQFDGFESETYKRLRGRDLASLKMKAVELMSEKNMSIVLVTTLVKGVNDHEMGALVDFALDQQKVRCLNVQTATFTGRYAMKKFPGASDPMDRITLDDVVQAICEQSRHGFQMGDFYPVPCPDPACRQVTYVHKEGEQVTPIPRLVNIEDYLDYIKNKSLVGLTDNIKKALEGLFSMSATPGEKTTTNFCEACGIDVDWGAIEEEITMIGMMHFMDEYNFDLARSKKCCVHEVLPDDGGIVPFCNYNVLRRGR